MEDHEFVVPAAKKGCEEDQFSRCQAVERNQTGVSAIRFRIPNPTLPKLHLPDILYRQHSSTSRPHVFTLDATASKAMSKSNDGTQRFSDSGLQTLGSEFRA